MAQYHQLQFLNFPEPPVVELHARKADAAHRLARRWSQAAADSGLEGVLSPAGTRSLQELLEKISRRDIVSPEVRGAIVQLAQDCSRSSAQRYEKLISPAARARAMEVNRAADLSLNEHSLQLYALAEAIDEVLDLEAALRRRREILS